MIRAASIRMRLLSSLSTVAKETLGDCQKGPTPSSKNTFGPPAVQRRETIKSLALPRDAGESRILDDSV